MLNNDHSLRVVSDETNIYIYNSLVALVAHVRADRDRFAPVRRRALQHPNTLHRLWIPEVHRDVRFQRRAARVHRRLQRPAVAGS